MKAGMQKGMRWHPPGHPVGPSRAQPLSASSFQGYPWGDLICLPAVTQLEKSGRGAGGAAREERSVQRGGGILERTEAGDSSSPPSTPLSPPALPFAGLKGAV